MTYHRDYSIENFEIREQARIETFSTRIYLKARSFFIHFLFNFRMFHDTVSFIHMYIFLILKYSMNAFQ